MRLFLCLLLQCQFLESIGIIVLFSPIVYSLMHSIQRFLSETLSQLRKDRHRLGFVIDGDDAWESECLEYFFQLFQDEVIFQIGGEPSHRVSKYVSEKRGQYLLGQQCQLLICDWRKGFDANSFSAALGTLAGGGMLVIVSSSIQLNGYAVTWMSHALKQLYWLSSTHAVPEPFQSRTLCESQHSKPTFEQQGQAIESIKKVVTGHRKRPLVLTADRGRGKTSALGYAAAHLMRERDIKIVVTAPSRSAVEPLFRHACEVLDIVEVPKKHITYQGSQLQFIAPDELMTQNIECDFVIVDESSAIPIPMLQQFVLRYHRLVFSTTIHGYEGCGRGFSLKFCAWLKQHRPQSRFFHLEQPIRWNEHDPLEQWQYQTFLLNAELPAAPQSSIESLLIKPLDKFELISSPKQFEQLFALLVQAHYQTSPNDFIGLLEDEAISIYAAYLENTLVGCLVTVTEGGLEPELIRDIQFGKRRPAGHLVPSILANHMGLTAAAESVSDRVMRIAVHPDLQQQGIGCRLIRYLLEFTHSEFVSTSFGATTELISFWQKLGFHAVRLGSQRDQSSGCHSVIMIHAKSSLAWLTLAQDIFFKQSHYLFSSVFSDLETDIIRKLFTCYHASEHSLPSLVRQYAHGGASYDAIASYVCQLLLNNGLALNGCSELLIRKVVQQKSWTDCAAHFQLSGRKHVEQQLRDDIKQLLSINLQCKN